MLQSGDPPPSRMVAIKCLVRKAGFSGGVAVVVAKNLRGSTAALYQGKWLRFLHRCWDLSPYKATIQQIAKFFLYLRGELKLLVVTVKGYWATLNHVFFLAGIDLAAIRVISHLFRSFEISCPPCEIWPPDWNLSLVLRSLTCLPYEPLKLSSDKHLTWKTSFLLALASVKRVSELHCLPYLVSHSSGWWSRTFSFVPTEYLPAE